MRPPGPPTGKSDSFRSCVRASEAACVRERMLLHPLGWGNSRSPPALAVFADRCWGFKKLAVILLTGAGVVESAKGFC